MGKYDSVISLVRELPACGKASGKFGALQARALPKLTGLRFAPNAIGDTCKIKADRTLCPKFLEELMQIEEKTDLLFATKVKDRMLQVMGYRHPEKLKVFSAKNLNNNIYMMNFDYATCELGLSESMLAFASKEGKIALIRHELDHFDKGMKVYRSVGKEKYLEALRVRFGNSEMKLREDVLDLMSKDANIENFDAIPYLESWLHPKTVQVKGPKDINALRNTLFYATEPFETSAYDIQKKILQALKQNDLVYPDVYGKPLQNVLDKLAKTGVSEEKQMEIFTELVDAFVYTYSSNPEILMKSYRNIQKGIFSDEVKNVLATFPKYFSLEMTQKMMLQINSWLDKGVYSIEDVLALSSRL